MKIKRWLLIFLIPLVIPSCNNDDGGGYTQVKTIEHQIFLTIKEFRTDNGQVGPFGEQYLFVSEAQGYSYKMANGFEEVGTQGLDEHWAILDEKYGFYNKAGLVLMTTSNDDTRILSELLLIPGADTTLLGDLTQCGVGVEIDSVGVKYVTVLVAKADS